MTTHESTALDKNQALLHGVHKGLLYTVGMTIGKRIAQARKKLRPKLTQGALGELVGASYQAVSQWEREKTEPELDKVPALANHLQVSIAWLLTGNDLDPSQRKEVLRRLIKSMDVEE